jgi:hypothetical protein
MNVQLLCGVVVILTLGIIGVSAIRNAYLNGVTDGYGAAREPHNPGYRKAANWLRTYMSHRWPELKQRADEHTDPDNVVL